MSKEKGKAKPDEAGDGFSEGPSTSKSFTEDEFNSPRHKKKAKGKSHPFKTEEQEREQVRTQKTGPPPGPPQQYQQPQGAWRAGPPPGPPQQYQQPQGAWRAGPPPGPPQQYQQPQGAWSAGPPPGPYQQFQQPQGAKRAGPSPGQPQGAWRAGPPPGPPQQYQQPQGAWSAGPPPGPYQQFQQPQGAKRAGPSPGQPQGAQRAGPPPGQPQQFQQPQGAWRAGPPPAPPQQFQQPQGAWRAGPPPGQPQQPQQPQGAWSTSPPPGFPQQPQEPHGLERKKEKDRKREKQLVRTEEKDPPPGPSHQQGAWERGPPSSVATSQKVQEPYSGPESSKAVFRIPKKSESKEKEKESSEKSLSTVTEGSIEFPSRITASKKSGRHIQVSTNFFPLIIMNPNIVVHHYDVVIVPDKPKFLMRAVWNKYISLMFPNRLTAFDGKNAYSRGPLANGESTSATVSVLNNESNREKEFQVSIQEVRKISLSCFQNYRERMIQSRSMKVLPEAELAVLDIIMRNWACDNFVRSARHFFPLSSSRPLTYKLSEKLDMRIGYFQSAFLGYKPYFNFDISHKAFYKDCQVLDIIGSFLKRSHYSEDFDFEGINHFMRNVKVEYEIPNNPSSRKIFRVNKLVDSANKQTFTKEDGTKLTVAQYFEIEKKYKLRKPDLPLLWVGPTQKSIYLPIELCRIAPDQIYRGMINPFETKEMVSKATSNARDRKRDVYSLFEKVKLNSHPLMKEFGLQVSTEMETVTARVLDPPNLRTSRNIRVDNGTWRIQDFLEPMCLRKWCILNLDNRTNKQSLMNFQKMLKTKGIEFRMNISDPSREPLNGEPDFQSLKRSFSHLKDMEMVFVVISEAKGIYSKVKAICETQEGILTQCVKGRTLSQDPRKLTTTVQNILLKVNAKLGGKNHCLDRSSMPQCLEGYVMVVGADVTHPSPGMKIPSVAAVTVSCDPAAFQYGTTTRVQPKGEMIKDLEEIISIHVKKFYQIRQKYPEKVIFFRDGVSEGELPKVFKNELLALKKACNGYCQPKITFVIVQKRHHTRFFPVSQADEQGKNFNVPVGTCVDTDIVHPRDLDFYLVSHASILGTARPTRYRLLHDDNKLSDEEVETLSYYLCHLFSRCNRSVSYPSPTYNAHLAAARVRAHLEGLNLMGGEDIERIKNNMPDHISRISPMYFV